MILYFLGVKNFLDVIILTGAILLGIESTLIILIYKNFVKKRFQRQAPWWIYLVLIFFLLGVIFPDKVNRFLGKVEGNIANFNSYRVQNLETWQTILAGEDTFENTVWDTIVNPIINAGDIVMITVITSN
ncbi:MAG: hypothetical protein ACK41O_15655, partial [Runella zeae]